MKPSRRRFWFESCLVTAACFSCLASCGSSPVSGETERIKPSWVHISGGEGNQSPRAFAIGPNGEIAVVGSYLGALSAGPVQLSGDGSVDGFVMLYNAAGEITWGQALVGPHDDNLTTVAFDGDSVVVAGHASRDSNFAGHPVGGSADMAAFVVRLDRSGTVEWQRTFAGTGFQNVSQISKSPDGNLLLTGSFTNTLLLNEELRVSGESDAFVAELGADGQVTWGRAIATEGSDSGRSVMSTADGLTLVTGTSDGMALDTELPAGMAPQLQPFAAAIGPEHDIVWFAPQLFGPNHSHHTGHMMGPTDDPALLSQGPSGELLFGVTRTEPTAISTPAAPKSVPFVGKASLGSLDAAGQISWRADLFAEHAEIELAAPALGQPLTTLVGSFVGRLEIPTHQLQSPRYALFMSHLGQDGNWDTAKLVALPSVDSQGKAISAGRIRAVASATAPDYTTWVLASISYSADSRDIVLLKF